jgi:two-component system chemotaxis response regulator CheY
MVKPVHLVISDLNMPKLDGMGLLQAMRTYPPTRNTGFIFLTGAGDRSLKERAARYGVFYYLEKPVTTPHLKSQIEVVLGPLK